MGGACGAYRGGKRLRRFLVGKPEGKRPLGRPRRRWKDIKMDLREVGGVETGWTWLRIGTDSGHLWIRWWTFGFHKVRGISWLDAELVSFSRRTLLLGVSKYPYTEVRGTKREMEMLNWRHFLAFILLGRFDKGFWTCRNFQNEVES